VILYCLFLSALNTQAMFRCKWLVFAINLFRKRLKFANDKCHAVCWTRDMRKLFSNLSIFAVILYCLFLSALNMQALLQCKQLAFAINLVRKRLRFAIKAFRNGWLRCKVLFVFRGLCPTSRHEVGVLLPVIRFWTQVCLEECTVLSASVRAEGEVVRNFW